MSTSRLRRALLAVAIGAVPVAAGGGAVALATTPPPVPTVTPTITPVPPTSYTMCLDPTPDSANRPAYLAAYAKNNGTSVYLTWGVATGPVFGGPCMEMPSRWRLYVDGDFLTEVTGDFFANYTVTGTKPGETHTYRVESVNNPQDFAPRETTLTVTETDTPPTPSPVPNGATPTPSPTPTPTPGPTPGPQLCLDPWNISPPATSTSNFARALDITDRSATLQWAAFGCRLGLVGYDIKLNGKVVKEVRSSTPWTAKDQLTGLYFNTTYNVEVIGYPGPGFERTETIATTQFTSGPPDETGWFQTPTPTPSPSPTPTPTPTPTATPTPTLARFKYSLQGSTTINTLTKGSMPLTGSIDAQLDVATGAYTAQTVINDTQGRLTALGFLPVTVGVGIVPSGPTTGKLVDDQLTANLKARIKVKSVKAFGAIPLAGGNECQSRQLSDIALASSDAFDPTGTGGTLTGTYAISDLNGCGVLNGLVSPLTRGGGNILTVKLTPAAG